MRKLSWITVAVCLLALPLFAQSRRGYNANGGWHRKATPPPVNKKRAPKRTPPSAPVVPVHPTPGR